MNQPTTPNTVEDFLPLPEPAGIMEVSGPNPMCAYVENGYTLSQVHAAILADRAQRPAVASGNLSDWMIDGSLLYRLNDDETMNVDEINITMAHGSRKRENREAAAAGLLNIICASEIAGRNAQPEQPASPTVAGSVDTSSERAMFEAETPGLNHQRVSDDDSDSSYRSRIVEDLWQGWEMRARLAPAAPSGEAEEDAYVIDRLGKLLAGVAVALNGPEPELTRWSYHDLPEKAAKLMLELELFRAVESGTAPSEIEAAVELPEFPDPLDEVRAKFRGDFDWVEPGENYYNMDTLTSYATEAVLKDRAALKRTAK